MRVPRVRPSTFFIFLFSLIELVVSLGMLDSRFENRTVFLAIFLIAYILGLLSLLNKSISFSVVSIIYCAFIVLLLLVACLFFPARAFGILFSYEVHWGFAGVLSSTFVLKSIATLFRINAFKPRKEKWD